MNQLNSIILEGNVAKKAELSEPVTGFIVCKFPIAVNRKTKSPDGEQHDEVSFFDVEAYGKTAESCSKYCDKGKGVRVVGRLKQNRWEENNVKHSKIYVVAEHVEYKFSKPKTDDGKSEAVKAAEATADAVVNTAQETKAEPEQTQAQAQNEPQKEAVVF